MDVVILGAGALGSILAAHVTRAGHQVRLIARGARAEQVERDGLRIRGLVDLDVRCAVVRAPDTIVSADVFVNTVKTYDSAAALASLGACHPRLAFSVQNGVVKEDELRARFGPAAVLGAMADFSGDLADDGTVDFSRNIGLHLGELDSPRTSRVEALASALQGAGITTRAVDDIESLIWSKYCGWVGLMLLAVLTRRSTGEYLQDADAARVIVQVTRETARLAHARGTTLVDISPMPVASILAGSEDEAVVVVQQVGVAMAGRAPGHRLSALQDLMRGRRVELEETVGHACQAGEALGLDMPVIRTCYRIAAAVNRGLA